MKAISGSENMKCSKSVIVRFGIKARIKKYSNMKLFSLVTVIVFLFSEIIFFSTIRQKPT